MASSDVLIRKFEINETKINQNRSTILYKVTCTTYKENLLESNENVTVWKKFKDFEKLHEDLQRLRSALYIKETVPSFPGLLIVLCVEKTINLTYSLTN